MKYIDKKNYDKQSGFSLYIVLIIMIVIAFLVVATMQSTSVNSRTSANDSDYQYALQSAQQGLLAAREKISAWPASPNAIEFDCNCKGGLCVAVGTKPNDQATKLIQFPVCSNEGWGMVNGRLKPVWLRENVFSDNNKDPSIKSDVKSEHKFRYVIEYLGRDSANTPGIYIFRITSKGWGKNGRTTSLIEETIQANLTE